MNWVSFATAVLGGAVGAVLTQLAIFVRDWLNKREEGRFTALTLALALESYAIECAGPYFDLANYVRSKYATPEPSGSLPALPEFSDKTNWRSIGVTAASDILGYRVKVNTAHGSIANTRQYDGQQGAWGEASESGIELGALALRIATGLRKKFRLGVMPKSENFDPAEFFAERLTASKAHREANAIG